MQGIDIQIKPEILDWILEEIQFMDVSTDVPDQINAWLSGKKKPTFSQIEKISRKTHIPFGYFFLKVPPKDHCEIVEYRTIDSKGSVHPSRDLIDTVDAMSNAQEWMSEYNKASEIEPYDFVGRFADSYDAAAIAEDIRSTLNLAVTWFESSHSSADSFRTAKQAASDAGILVMMNGIVGNNTKRVLRIEEFRAFTLIDRYAPLIFINARDTDNGKVFSLFHELAHVWIGRNSFYNEPSGSTEKVSRLEQVCNAVAAELIVPNELFIQKWQDLTGDDHEKIHNLARHFKCSRYVVCRRALDNHFIDHTVYAALIAEFNRQLPNNSSKGSGGDYYKTLRSRWDRHFILALNESARSGNTQYSDVYQLTGTNGRSFAELVLRTGGDT